MQRENVFDSLIISGGFIVGLMILQLYLKMGETISNDMMGVLLIPINIILIGIIFRMQLAINPIKEESKESKKQRVKQNKTENEIIVKKYNSMPDLESQSFTKGITE